MPAALAARGVTKRFGALVALDRVDFELARGEVHALIGQNGAGKSTLVSLMSGGTTPDEGFIEVAGVRETSMTPETARRARVRVIHQERQLCAHLSVAENINLGSLPTRRADIVDWSRAHRTACETLALLGVEIDSRAIVGELTRAEQQIVEIAKAVHQDALALLMDEPTAALSQVEADRLLDLVSRLRANGTGIVYVSHQMGEIRRLADRVTVIRDGTRVGTYDPRSRTADELGALMLGNAVKSRAVVRSRSMQPGRPILEVTDLRGAGVEGVSFVVREHEILAITGLLGSGHLETALTLFGAQARTGGTVTLDGRPFRPKTPADSCARGFGFVPPDRKKQGVLADLTIAENVVLPELALRHRTWVTRKGTLRFAEMALKDLAVRAGSLDAPPKSLSGGNQQKVVFGKWTAVSARVLLLAEPTSGIDVGAREEIFKVIDSLAVAGSAVVLTSSDFGEVSRVATRVIVMNRGRIAAEIDQDALSADRLFSLASQ
jgi:ABC-type sugar transport system ATPase subunit